VILEVAVKTIVRSCLVGIISVGMMSAPAFAAPKAAADEKPVGLVTQASMAQLGDAKATIGTTVYPGDTLATDQGGLLRLKIGTSQIYLLSASSATLSDATTSNVSAKVIRGTVGISTTGSDPVALEIPEGILRSANGEPTYGQVTITGPNEVVITTYSGSMVLDNDGELHTIPAGKTYRVTMDLVAANTEPAQDAAGAETSKHQTKSARHRHLVFDIIMVGGTAIVAYALYEHLTISPH
jgi:hypothetical protein